MNQLDSEFKNKFNKAVVVILTQTRDSTKDTYIRNRIHHPENTNNSVETTDEIHESIIALQNIVSSLI